MPFSVTNSEIGVNGKVNRAVIVTRYSSHIERMFNHHVTPRKTSRELTYIEEEEEISTPDVKVSRLKKDQKVSDEEKESEVSTVSESNDNNVTVVRLEKLDIESGDTGDNASEEIVTNVTTKDSHDKHRVRFTANVQQIDYQEQANAANEKTS